MRIKIPAGLAELLQGFTVEVRRHQPGDLLEFALPTSRACSRRTSAKAQSAMALRAGPGETRAPLLEVSFAAEEPLHTGSRNREQKEGEEAADTGVFKLQ